MVDYPGIQLGSVAAPLSLVDDAHTAATAIVGQPGIVLDPFVNGTYLDEGSKSDKVTNTDYDGYLGIDACATVDWFERFHVIARSYVFGNLLSQQTASLEVFSAFRNDLESWSTFANNAGAGVSLAGQPALPKVFQPFEGSVMTLTIDTSGPPSVDSTLDFVFSTVPQTTQVPIQLQRVLLVNVVPEKGYVEILEFFTDIFPHVDGTEDRSSPRKNARQLFEWTIRVEEGPEHSQFENILFDWQQRAFGIPMWHEATTLTVATVAASTLTVNVASTDYADWRVGGLGLVYTDRSTFDVLEVASLTATTITFSNPTQSAHAVRALVIPLRTAFAKKVIRGSRWRVGMREYQMSFRVDDNDIDIGSTAAFSTFNSKVLLDGCNVVNRIMQEELTQDQVIIDGTVGKTEQVSPWERNKRSYQYTFFVQSQQSLWELRQLLHSLRGQWKSFYVPTFNKDLQPILDLTSAQNTLDVTNVGYTLYVRERQSRNVIQILFTDGTYLMRTITSSAEVDATRETLTLDSTWPSTKTVDEVARISYVEEVRFNSDRIQITHEQANGRARIKAPLITSFD